MSTRNAQLCADCGAPCRDFLCAACAEICDSLTATGEYYAYRMQRRHNRRRSRSATRGSGVDGASTEAEEHEGARHRRRRSPRAHAA